jgi:uncharacterized protein with HEPN domain
VIIGEALNQLARLDPAIVARVTRHRRIIGLRNILVHSYAKVDDRVVWSIQGREGRRAVVDAEGSLARVAAAATAGGGAGVA